MDHLQQIKKLLEWNDSGAPTRVLTPRKATEVQQGQLCRACLVAVISVGDLIEPYDDQEGWAITNCKCRWKNAS